MYYENKNCHYKLSNLYKQFHYEAHMLEKPPGALWNMEYTYMILLLHPTFNRKSTTMNTQRTVAKARAGILELLLPQTATQFSFQVINKFIFYTN
jgi:hypothetical protein